MLIYGLILLMNYLLKLKKKFLINSKDLHLVKIQILSKNLKLGEE